MSHGRRRHRRSRRIRRDRGVIQRLRLINHRQREYLAVVSHELRTPLVAILGGIELLRRDGAHSGGWHAMVLDQIEASATHLRDLLSDVLDLSTAEAGRMHLTLQPVSVAQACSQAVQLVDASARSKQIAIEIEIDDALDCVRADPRRLRQILANLLSNAVKFTRDAGRVGVRATHGGSFAVFEVWDDGPGLRPEEVERLSAFEPYTRLMNSPDVPAGAGLGLAIVKRLVDLHAGRLAIHSAPGEGSRFRIEIPLAATGDVSNRPIEQAAGEELGSDDAKAGAARGVRVLLVDDVAGNVVIASTYLRRTGFDVMTADSAQRALDILRHSPVDVLVCDVRMPDMDGVALAKLVRSDPRFADLPILALTASSQWHDRRRCLAAGMQEVLLKPLALRDLANSIVRHSRPRPDGYASARAMHAELECDGDQLSGPPAFVRVLHDINDALGAAIGNLDLALSAEHACDRAMLRDAFDSCRRVAELLIELRAALQGSVA